MMTSIKEWWNSLLLKPVTTRQLVCTWIGILALGITTTIGRLWNKQPAPQPQLKVVQQNVAEVAEKTVAAEAVVEVVQETKLKTQKEKVSSRQRVRVKTPVLLGLSGSGEAIVAYKTEAYSLRAATQTQDKLKDTALSETANTLSLSAETSARTEVKQEVSLQVDVKLPQFAIEVRFGDAWVPTETAKCVTGATGWMGCLKLVDVGGWARVGDSQGWVGAGGGVNRWWFGTRYEF